MEQTVKRETKKPYWIYHIKAIGLALIVVALISFPTLIYFLLNGVAEKKIARNPDEARTEVFTLRNNFVASFDESTCNAQTIACNPDFQANKNLACGAFKGDALKALMDDPACQGLDKSYVEAQLDEACQKGCIPATPTSTPKPPSPTLTPSTSYQIKGIKFSLPGIGNGQYENKSPNRTNRQVIGILFDSSSKTKIAESQSTFSYNSADGVFVGDFSFQAQQQRSYYFTIRTDATLSKRSDHPMITKLSSGDISQDNQMDIADYNLMISCYKGQAACTTEVAKLSDLNDDGTIQGSDLNVLQRAFSQGAGQLTGQY